MAHRSIYECDECKKEIGENHHISLMLNIAHHSNNNANGIAMPPTEHRGWKMKGFKTNFIHFCNGSCAKKFFDKHLKEAKKK